jgi:hypothetical protein
VCVPECRCVRKFVGPKLPCWSPLGRGIPAQKRLKRGGRTAVAKCGADQSESLRVSQRVPGVRSALCVPEGLRRVVTV